MTVFGVRALGHHGAAFLFGSCQAIAPAILLGRFAGGTQESNARAISCDADREIFTEAECLRIGTKGTFRSAAQIGRHSIENRLLLYLDIMASKCINVLSVRDQGSRKKYLRLGLFDFLTIQPNVSPMDPNSDDQSKQHFEGRAVPALCVKPDAMDFANYCDCNLASACHCGVPSGLEHSRQFGYGYSVKAYLCRFEDLRYGFMETIWAGASGATPWFDQNHLTIG